MFVCPGANCSHRSLLSCSLKKNDYERIAPVALYKKSDNEWFTLLHELIALLLSKNERCVLKTDKRIPNPAILWLGCDVKNKVQHSWIFNIYRGPKNAPFRSKKYILVFVLWKCLPNLVSFGWNLKHTVSPPPTSPPLPPWHSSSPPFVCHGYWILCEEL